MRLQRVREDPSRKILRPGELFPLGRAGIQSSVKSGRALTRPGEFGLSLAEGCRGRLLCLVLNVKLIDQPLRRAVVVGLEKPCEVFIWGAKKGNSGAALHAWLP